MKKLSLYCRTDRIMVPAMMRLTVLLLSSVLALAGCLSVRTEPIEVKPIHITVDVNVKIDRALNDFFGVLDRKSATPSS